ncbi:MAG: flagellar hook-basal body complex protein [Paracoccaceae bacterium]|nr:flagellar hook-basal body complex protein [Paracoccaceae bacterium]
MDNASYASLTRMSGLLREMDTVANNIANLSTTGYRREGLVFSEFIQDTGAGEPSLSMGHATGRVSDLSQGALTQTNGTYDLAIEGGGFFLIDTPGGQQLTRAGAFTPNDVGELVTSEGYRLLDEGGAPVFVPPDAATVSVGPDGTVSADGDPLGRIGLYAPADPLDLSRASGVAFAAPGGVEPVEGQILQGFVEESNVNPVAEIARMIEVQRAYEMGQGFLDQEDERIRSAIRTLTSN